MRSLHAPILPGATVGILGNGQLGRMLALSARTMGYRVAVLGPGDDSPAGQVADRVFEADYDNLEAVREFARLVDVVTFEFENVSAAATAEAGRFAPVRPSDDVLYTTQNRLREKRFLRSLGCAVAPFAAITNREEIEAAVALAGLPGVLKTAGFGYDGKGQRMVHTLSETAAAWEELGSVECILEGFVSFAFEASVVAARGVDGSFAAYPVVRNDHAHHILDTTTAPAPALTPIVAKQAEEIAHTILDSLQVVGLLCIELFVTSSGVIVNELAPRPHNSGHWTIEGADTSQFEQQIRAVCGLPPGSPALRRPGAAMANLMGDLWTPKPPNWAAALAIPGIHLHLYGKLQARPGRKMGHLTALADSPEEAVRAVRAAREALIQPTP